MTELSNNIFKDIDFYTQFKSLSENYRPEKYLEEPVKEDVLKIFTKLGFAAKYNSKGQFFRVSQVVEDWLISLTISLKYGVCEIIFGGINKDKTSKIGGPAVSIYKRLEILNGIRSDSYLKNPAFATYEELEEIMKVTLDLYTDLIKVVASKLHQET